MTAREIFRLLRREPIIHFAVLGALVFAIHRTATPQGTPVVVSRRAVQELEQEFAAHMRRPATPEETGKIVARIVDEEIFAIEAVSLGLDRGDPVVRRRLAEKMVSTLDDRLLGQEPPDAELQAIFDAHADRYRGPGRFTFQHVFLNRSRRGSALDADAAQVLGALTAGEAPERLGDLFARGASYAKRTPSEIDAVFGQGFAAALADAPQGKWTGPIPSGQGVHLVQILERIEGARLSFPEAREQLRQEWLEERRKKAVQELRSRLRARHRVELEPGVPPLPEDAP